MTVLPFRPSAKLPSGLGSAPPVRDYAEASYFDGYHFQHIADFYEYGRLAQIERKWRVFWGGRR